MTDHPALMSAPMVRAILREIEQLGSGKTMTRRLAWRKRKMSAATRQAMIDTGVNPRVPTIWQSVRPGDRLWVREPVYWSDEGDNFYFTADRKGCGVRAYREWRHGRNRPPMFLHRWASRLTLVVTTTWVELLQEISEADARAEGIYPTGTKGYLPPHPDMWSYDNYAPSFDKPEVAYWHIWQSLHTKPGARWEDNPEVVPITFVPHLCNIDAMALQEDG